jgi:hypothetical protein
MKAEYAVGLVEHPGHPDQSVHGRRGGRGSSPSGAIKLGQAAGWIRRAAAGRGIRTGKVSFVGQKAYIHHKGGKLALGPADRDYVTKYR